MFIVLPVTGGADDDQRAVENFAGAVVSLPIVRDEDLE